MTNITDNRLIDGIVVKKRIIAEVKEYANQFVAVSYTHLTLPTILLV